jgi:hypothetical protein
VTRRSYVTAHRLDGLHGQLTDADWAVLDHLRRLRVATGLQMQRLVHGQGEAAKHRRLRQLTRLSRLRVVTRMERRAIGGIGGGSRPSVYVLDVSGLRLVNPQSKARRPWQPSTPFVEHAVMVSEVFVGLVEAERRGRLELLGFDAEPRCWRHWPNRHGEAVTLKPDADVTVAVGEFEHHWFVEADRATESLPRITRKAAEYVDYLATGAEQAKRGVVPKVAFIVPDERRLEAVADALHRLPVEHWHLFAVATESTAVRLLAGEASI